MGVGEFTLALAQPGEIKSHDCDTLGAKGLGNIDRGTNIFGAGKTVCKQGPGQWLSCVRAMNDAGQAFTAGTRDSDGFLHGRYLSFAGVMVNRDV
jgi:hypothetical protein